MTAAVIIDTGPLVALLSRGDQFHEWAAALAADFQTPILTCEAVITETCFLLRPHPTGVSELLRLVDEKLIVVPFRIDAESRAIEAMMTRYANIPMSLADACLVRMAELHGGYSVLTIDSDFRIYRMHQRRPIPLIMPDGR